MNARQMVARYAQGGMIDEVGELRANMGGEVSEARRMLQRFADGGEANQIFTDEATGERYSMVKGPDGKAYRSDRPIPGVSQGLSPEEQAAYADSLRKSQEVTALGMLQRVNALRQQEEALSPNKMEWFDQAQRLMKEDPNYQMLQRQRPELFDPVSSAVQEAQGAYQTEQAAPASQQLWESKVYQQNYGQGNVLDSVYRDPTTGYGVVSLRDPKGFVERGIVDQKGNFLVGGNYRAQDLLEDAQRVSPKFSENISSLLKSQGITPGVNDTFFRFQPYQQVTGEGTERTDTPFAQPVPTTTLLKDIPRTSPYQTQVDRMRELYENLSKRLKGVKGEPGMPGYTEERPFFAPFGFASGGSVAKNEKSEARRMLQNLSSPVQHFANGSEVASPPPSNLSEGLQYATREGGIGAAKYYENIRNFVNTQGADLNAAEVRAEMEKYGVSDKDVRDALAGTQYSGAAVHALLNPDIGAADAPGRGVGGLEGMSANIRDYIQDQVAAKMTREQLGNVLTQQMGAYNPETGVGGFNEQDLIRATGKTASQLLNDLYGVNQKPPPVVTTVVGGQGNDTIKGAQDNDFLFQPPSDLPPLTDIFVPPTAPPPSAPPPALTPGQEGLDPSTAIVGAIPQSERVKIPQPDTQFRASAPRTPTYDRFGRITGYTYSPAAKLTPATGTNVFNFVPPGITSRPRSLLNLGDVPGVMVDPVTGQMRLPLSASQQFARDRSTLDNQFRQLYARAAASDKSLPAQAPTSAAAAFRNFVMSGEDPMLQNKLRFRDIEQQKYDPTKADPALRAQYGQSAFVSDLAAAFDPFLARNRAALTSLAEQQAPKSYSEMYPDIAEAYAKLKPEDKAKFPTLRDYELYHFDTYGRKEGRTSPLSGMGALQSPYATAFFSKGGEASTEDFIKKQSGGDVSRGTESPNTAEVPKLTSEGQLIDENAEMRSESQRMLNRLKTAQQENYRRGKLPQKNEDAEKVRKDIREGMRALVGMGPYDETNPTEAYRIAATPTPLAAVGMIGRKGLLGMLDKARGSTAFKGRGLDVAEAEQFSVKELMNRLKEQGIDVDRTWLRGKKDPGGGFEKPPTYEYLEAVYEYQKRPDAVERALKEVKTGRPWSYSGTLSRQSGDRDVTKYNTKGGVWLTESPTIAESYSGDKGFIIPVLTRRPEVVLDAKGEQWDEFFKTSKEFKEAQRDPNVKSVEVKNIIDFGGRSKLPSGLSDDELRKLLTANNLFLKKPFVDKDVVSKLTGEPFPYQDGGPVNVPRETSTSKQQLDKLAQESKRKKA